MTTRRNQVQAFLDDLRKELVGQFRVEPDHAGIERILDEVRAHLEDAVAERLQAGATRAEAVSEALDRLGTVGDVARAYRLLGAPHFVHPRRNDPAWRRLLRGRISLGSWLAEVRFALRGLRRSPTYTVAFILTLGLGIGANTAIFSVVHGVWLRPLPYRDGDRLVYLRHSAKLAGIDNTLFSVPEIDDYRQQSTSFEGVAEFSALTFTMIGLDEPRRVRAGIVTGNYFEVMGLGARLGRVISEIDDGEAAEPVAVLTHDYWYRLFGGDPAVVGRTVTMNGRSVTIVGVAQPAPPYPERTDIYVNMVVSPHHLSASMTDDRVHRMTEVFARLTPEATVESARVEVDQVTRRLHQEYPEAYDAAHGYEVSMVGLRDQLAAEARPAMLMLLAVAAFVLAIACANVANLTLARVMQRHDEWALRSSLGARPATLRRQLLIENLIPSVAGAALGILVALVGVDLLAAYVARYSVRASEIRVDATVLAVALSVAFAAAGLFALLPRLPGASTRKWGWLAGTRTTASLAGRRMQRMLVVSQLSVCFVLLVGAGLLLETLLNLERDDGGLVLEEVMAMDVPIIAGKRTRAERRTYYQTILEHASSLPGVRSAALGSLIPLKEAPTGLSAFIAALEFEIHGEPQEPGAPAPRADFRSVSKDYFRTLGITLVEGRLFAATDEADAPKVVVINQALADHYFPDRDPIGQRIGWRGDVLRFIGVSEQFRTIVGVVSDAKDYGLANDVPHVVFHPFAQEPSASSLFIRTARPEAVVRPIVRQIRELDPEQPIENIATLAQVRSQAISSQRLNATLVGAFAALALALAAVGVAGVLAFSVSQRTHEFGVRAALGADRRRLMRVVLQEGAALAAAGLGIGIAASVFLSELISALLYQVAPADPPTFGFVAALLMVVALIASSVPAWRAADIDPVEALRAE